MKWGLTLGKGKGISLSFKNVMIDTGAHPASYSVGTRRSSLLQKDNRSMKLTPYLHVAQTLKMCGVILLLPFVCLYDVDRDNLIFTFSIHNCALVEDNNAVCQGEIIWEIVH